MNKKIFDVLIIGAGPVGLATAIGLHERGIENIIVVDRDRVFRRVGQIVDDNCRPTHSFTRRKKTSKKFSQMDLQKYGS